MLVFSDILTSSELLSTSKQKPTKSGMTNYWAIAIGINQYELFQPLSCAQNDAEALKDFLVTDVGFLPQNCLLMTNTSPPVGEKSSYPNQDNILFFLEVLTTKFWQPQDYLWLFFSGYGVNYNDKDYLMPADGNPDQVLETGIEVSKIMQTLHNAKLNVLLIFDINRAFGTQADAPVGEDILKTAQQLKMATVLSCQPDQFSHEISELGHGIFTATLMAALRSGQGGNLHDLESYLSSLTPQLCEHHWRPVQNPATFIPDSAPFMLPGGISDQESQSQELIFPEENFAVASATPPPTPVTETPNTYKAWWAKDQSTNQSVKTNLSNSNSENSPSTLTTSPELNTGSRFIPPSAKDYAKPTTQINNTPIWQQFILWGGGSMIIVGLITTFLLRNQASFRFHKVSTSLNNTGRTAEFPQSLPPIPDQVAPIAPANNPQVSSFNSQQRNQAIAELRKMSLSPTNASDLSQAISITQKVPPGETLTPQAQENIQIWSQMILNLAQEDVQRKQYDQAIAKAELIPKNTAFYPQVQSVIAKWRLESQQYTNNQIVLDAAQGLIQPGQASSYNKAIAVAKKIPPGQPGHDLARKYMNQWSEEILTLAKTRAEQGDLQTAIATAALVPELTIAYEDAQDVIQKWKSQ
jgi:hypothetical protein